MEESEKRSRAAVLDLKRAWEYLPPDGDPGELKAVVDCLADIVKRSRGISGLDGSDTKAGSSVSERDASKDDKE